MARLATKRSAPEEEGESSTTRRNTARRITPSRTTQVPSESPSPAISFSSDKENSTATAAREAREKTRGASSAATTPAAGPSRRGLEDRSLSAQPHRGDARPTPARTGSGRETGGPEEGRREDPHSILDTRFYDPEQTLVERRPVRKAIRDLTRELQESRHDYMATHSSGIYDTLIAANQQFQQIKQTSDATLDANLLVKAADLAARRAVQNRVGGAVRGLDASEFAARCAAFMRRGPAANQIHSLAADIQSAVNRGTGRHRIGAGADSDGENETNQAGNGATQGGNDDGDELNWAWLGLRAAAPASSRPRVPGFLLGPLSVQKKARAATQRTARQAAPDPSTAVRPAELDASAIERVENANLTALCRKIFKTLRRYRAETLAKVEAQVSAAGDMDPAQLETLLDAHHLCDNSGVDLLHFAFDPHSFGQTVENLFYISFLVRDGKAGLARDSKGRLSLHPTDPSGPAAHSSDAAATGGKRQAVFHLDFDTWRDVCREFDIAACIIGHRADDGTREIAEGGWYG